MEIIHIFGFIVAGVESIALRQKGDVMTTKIQITMSIEVAADIQGYLSGLNPSNKNAQDLRDLLYLALIKRECKPVDLTVERIDE
jgi:hypothetical protein